MLTKIRTKITVTEKKTTTATIMATNSHSSDYQDTNNNQINFKMEVVSTIKRTEILKCTWFHVIPYIHFPLMGLFPHIPMETISTFPGASLMIKKPN